MKAETQILLNKIEKKYEEIFERRKADIKVIDYDVDNPNYDIGFINGMRMILQEIGIYKNFLTTEELKNIIQENKNKEKW